MPNASRMDKTSKNRITIPQLKMACRHVKEMRDADITENFAIRLLEHFADSFANQYKGGRGKYQPLSANNIDRWSKAAEKARSKNSKRKFGEYVRVEHGTPRRYFAKLVLELFEKNQLNEKNMRQLVRERWRLAVITIKEDKRLSERNLRSAEFSSPYKRWQLAKIEF